MDNNKPEPRKDLRRRQFTEEEILEYLVRRAKLLRRTPTVHDLNLDREGPTKPQIEKIFVSYDLAIEAAGLEPLPRPWSKWDDDELIDLLIGWKETHPNAAITYSLLQENPELPGINVVQKRFGSIKGWLEAAGFEYVEPKSPWRTSTVF
ncbi:hypothetical protein IKG07_01500 [Candidatus Saccharibacteria bacterium]|nr:hypothetical protein [Candidatus Saccharibacteria bacterium]